MRTFVVSVLIYLAGIIIKGKVDESLGMFFLLAGAGLFVAGWLVAIFWVVGFMLLTIARDAFKGGAQ